MGACKPYGKWRLVAVLSDPGNGNGKFVDEKSDRTIEGNKIIADFLNNPKQRIKSENPNIIVE